MTISAGREPLHPVPGPGEDRNADKANRRVASAPLRWSPRKQARPGVQGGDSIGYAQNPDGARGPLRLNTPRVDFDGII